MAPRERTAASESDPTGDGSGSEAGDDAYGGLLGAFPYAFRASPSRLFQSYVALGGLAACLVALLFGLALVTVFGRTVGVPGGAFTFVRAFFVVVGLFVVAPLLAPVLLVARRHRRGARSPGPTTPARYDAAMALAGYLVLVSLYVGAVVTAPENLRDPPSGVLAPVVRALYDAPPSAGVASPVIASAVLVAVHRALR
jgi:hypothetical protein